MSTPRPYDLDECLLRSVNENELFDVISAMLRRSITPETEVLIEIQPFQRMYGLTVHELIPWKHDAHPCLRHAIMLSPRFV